jgi:hypothetical protein
MSEADTVVKSEEVLKKTEPAVEDAKPAADAPASDAGAEKAAGGGDGRHGGENVPSEKAAGGGDGHHGGENVPSSRRRDRSRSRDRRDHRSRSRDRSRRGGGDRDRADRDRHGDRGSRRSRSRSPRRSRKHSRSRSRSRDRRDRKRDKKEKKEKKKSNKWDDAGAFGAVLAAGGAPVAAAGPPGMGAPMGMPGMAGMPGMNPGMFGGNAQAVMAMQNQQNQQRMMMVMQQQQMMGLMPAQQAGSKKQRELYVGNLAQGMVSETMLKDLFTNMFQKVPAFDVSKGPAVVTVQVRAPSKRHCTALDCTAPRAALTARCPAARLPPGASCCIPHAACVRLRHACARHSLAPSHRLAPHRPASAGVCCSLFSSAVVRRRHVRLCGVPRRGGGRHRHPLRGHGPVRPGPEGWPAQWVRPASDSRCKNNTCSCHFELLPFVVWGMFSGLWSLLSSVLILFALQWWVWTWPPTCSTPSAPPGCRWLATLPASRTRSSASSTWATSPPAW